VALLLTIMVLMDNLAVYEVSSTVNVKGGLTGIESNSPTKLAKC
jgi:hypothetical protein